MNKKILIYFPIIISSILFITYSISKANLENSVNIIINEIASFEDSNSEWIEVLNISENSIDLSNWKFYEDATKHTLKAYQGDLIIKANEYAVIADEAETFLRNNPAFLGTIIDSSWTTLNESGEEIGLVDSNGNFIELFTYIEAKDRSLERKDPYANIYSSENWSENNTKHSAGFQNSNFRPSSEGNEAETTDNPDSQEAETKNIEDVKNADISFDGAKININFDFPDDIENSLIIKSTHSIDASPENGISYKKGDFLNTFEIVGLQDSNTFSDSDFEEENTYFYKIYSFDENFNYSNGIEKQINIPYLIKSTDILINEFYPAPNEGENEWIEIFNNSEKTINLDVLYLIDESTTKNPLSGKIKSKEYLVIDSPKFTLNNDADSVNLYNNASQIINSISYGKDRTISAPAKGKSAGLLNNIWTIFSNPTKNIENKIINNKPTAIITVQSGALEGEGKVKINLDGTNSYDIDGDLLTYEWDFGDGEILDAKNPNTKTYDEAGEYIIKLTVKDIFDEIDSAEIKIKVKQAKESSSSKSSKKSSTKKSTETKSSETDKSNSTGNTDTNAINTELFQYIKINELMPNPEGSDTENEWIELKNIHTEKINLNGLYLDDNEKGSSKFDLSNFTIEANAYLVLTISDTNITLNQSNDSVRLLDAVGNLIDEIKYTESIEGHSYSNFADSWDWTNSPTQGTENTYIEDKNTEELAENSNETDQGENIVENSSNEKIFVTEFLPNPEGKDDNSEWIELFNDENFDVNLKSWGLDDSEGGSKMHKFENDIFIKAKSYLTIYRYDSKINLNNDDDFVRLFSPNSLLYDQVEYTEAKEGFSFAKFDDGWKLTASPSPNSENIFEEESSDDEDNDEKKYKDGNLTEDILISEIMPNPEGTDTTSEWIEIFNKGDKNINLGNWYLAKANSSKKYTFTDKDLIKANSYFLLPRSKTKLALDNSKGSLYLYNFEDDLISEVSYEKSIEGESYANIKIIDDRNNTEKTSFIINRAKASKIENGNLQDYWTWTKEPTPNKENPVFHKMIGTVSEQLNDYIYIETGNGEKLQVNLSSINIDKDLSANLLQKGNMIELLAQESSDNSFELKEFSILNEKTKNLIEQEDNENYSGFTAIFILSLIAGLILSVWKLKEKGLLKKILTRLAEMT